MSFRNLYRFTREDIDKEFILDKEFTNNSIVKLVDLTPNFLFATIESEREQWQVMTYRLTPIKQDNS